MAFCGNGVHVSEDEPDGWSLLVTQDPDFYAFATPSQASGLSTNLAQLITRPFFGMGSGEYRASLFTANAATANAWLSNATNEWRVLAGAIPVQHPARDGQRDSGERGSRALGGCGKKHPI